MKLTTSSGDKIEFIISFPQRNQVEVRLKEDDEVIGYEIVTDIEAATPLKPLPPFLFTEMKQIEPVELSCLQ